MKLVRCPLTVNLRVTPDGKVRPTSLIFCNQEFTVDNLLEARLKYAAKPGELPPGLWGDVDRFRVIVEGYEKIIYRERDTNQWFSVREFENRIEKEARLAEEERRKEEHHKFFMKAYYDIDV